MVKVELHKGKIVAYKGRLARIRELLDENTAMIQYEELTHAADGWVENPTEIVPIALLVRMISRNDVKINV